MGEMLADKWVLVISFVLVMAATFNLAWQMMGGKRQSDNKEDLSSIEKNQNESPVPANLPSSSEVGEVDAKVEQVDIPASSVVDKEVVSDHFDNHEQSDVRRDTMENTQSKPNKNFGMVSMSPNWKMVDKNGQVQDKKTKNMPIPSVPSRSVNDVLRESGHAFSIDVANPPEIREEVLDRSVTPATNMNSADQELQLLANEVIEQEMKVLSEAVVQSLSSETGDALHRLDSTHQGASFVDTAKVSTIALDPMAEVTQVAAVVAESVIETTPVVAVVAEPVVEATPVVAAVAESVVEATPVAAVAAEPVIETTPVVAAVAESVVETTPVVVVVAEPVVDVTASDVVGDVQLSQPLMDVALTKNQPRHVAEPSILMAGTVNAIQSIQEAHAVLPSNNDESMVEASEAHLASVRYDVNSVRLQQNVKGLSSSISDRFNKMPTDIATLVEESSAEVAVAEAKPDALLSVESLSLVETEAALVADFVTDDVALDVVKLEGDVTSVQSESPIEPEVLITEVVKLDAEPQQNKVRRSLASYSFAK